VIDVPDRRRIPWLLRYAVLGRAASEARRLTAKASHVHANLEFQGPAWLGPGFSLRMFEDGATLRIGPNVDFRRDFTCEVGGQGEVVIGAGCVFTGMAMIQCSTSVRIGDGAIFGQGLVIADGNHRFRDPNVPFLDQGYDFRPITVGAGAVVLSSCTIVNDIGERALIGANSVVTRPIPPYSLAVGAPARVVEYFGPPELRPAGLGL
jgi:acetyltransferase-like isoleucine patch superfamily enzyme